MGEAVPVYEYECPGCGCKFEIRQDISGRVSEVKCGKCQKVVKRRISVVNHKKTTKEV